MKTPGRLLSIVTAIAPILLLGLSAFAAEPFPTQDLLPKTETGVARFLAAHPEYDGRGVIVAIFDSGVDPGAPGLKTTSDGKPKIIDMIDGTGSGDVVTNTVRMAQEHRIEGLSGRRLQLGQEWTNPSGQWRVGLKRGYDFFPGELVGRLTRERRKRFDSEHAAVEGRLRREILKWDAAHPNPSVEEKREQAEINERLAQLQHALKTYDDPGPLFDCVTFHDGRSWRAVVDTDENGDLSEEKLLANYRDEHEFATFGNGSLLNFAVNIHDEGNRLTIVADCGTHGTHVAGIVAGCFPDNPDMNGIAPGAQIVSVKIGDSRIDGMETGVGLVRGLAAVLDTHCDLINMSYGEPTSAPNRGRLTGLFSEIVNEHGVIFVSSAGNSGPALSTVGAPGGCTSAVIGVGAYLSPEMMAAAYSLRRQLPEMPYTWTSRGPASDGDLGIDIFAPGGAFSPVSNWTLSRLALMNGTSMASPSACGAIALLLSGLKAEGIAYSPRCVRRALQNTARRIEDADVFAQGPGLVQVDRAWEFLKGQADAAAEWPRFEVDIPGRDSARGLYLREPHEADRKHDVRVRVRAIFPERADRSKALGFEMPVRIEATEPWVEAGEHLLLESGDQTFDITVDPTGLETGVHFAEVHGLEAARPENGPLFRVPITVIRPTEIEGDDPSFTETLEFTAGGIERRFFAVPDGATWADLTLRLRSDDGQRRVFVVQPAQLVPGESLKDDDLEREYFTLQDGIEQTRSLPVTGGRTLELCLAQYWSSLGKCELEYELDFHGLEPSSDRVEFAPGEPRASVDVAAPLRRERVAPSAELTTLRKVILPTEAQIRPLDLSRDRLPDGRPGFELVLTYTFEMDDASSVTPRFPANDGLLYDSPLESQLWLLFDEGKRRVAADDVWPESVKLGKGTYVLKLRLQHRDADVLDKLRSAVLYLDRELSSPISLDIYPNRVALEAGTNKFQPQWLDRNQHVPVWIAAPPAKQLPEQALPGDSLLGKITFGERTEESAGSGERPGGFPVKYAVPPRGAAADEAETKESTEAAKKTAAEQLAETLHDAKVALLQKLVAEDRSDEFLVLYEQFREEYPDDLPILAANLHRLDQEQSREEHLPEIIAAADIVLAKIDLERLTAHYGTNVNPEDEDAVRLRKKMDDVRAILVDALYRKGRALGYRELPEVVAKHPIEDPEALDRAFENNFAELRKWVDTTDPKYVLLHVRRERRKGRHGEALKLLNKHIADSPPNCWYVKKRRDIYEALGWKHLAESESKWLAIRFPKEDEPF